MSANATPIIIKGALLERLRTNCMHARHDRHRPALVENGGLPDVRRVVGPRVVVVAVTGQWSLRVKKKSRKKEGNEHGDIIEYDNTGG
jgi:hypothetical protein